MRFDANEDMAALMSGLEQIALGEGTEWEPSGDWSRQVWSQTLDSALDENGYYDAAEVETLGPVAAAALVCRLSRLAVNVEAAASALLRPVLGVDLPRPLAVDAGRQGGAIRFLPQARALLRLTDTGATYALLAEGDVTELPTLAAYPMGALTGTPDWQRLEADPEQLRDLWRVAVAAELTGAMRGGLDAVVAHVTDREQFGRPLGTFQGIQHRLATAASRIEAAQWLTLRAAQQIDPADATIALGYTASISTQVVYDLHQFMGAMGLTLEHPLHRWSYRLRFLRSELGGATENLQLAADRLWRDA
ncbi:acyl-CoA dehydrogenase family protein [Pseudooceanicola sp. 200-1SW]|uniref:acyl-CoA dehydrogenase family protein n=1 Tax=Pseudooceanicola sp. 200-1SW TaxID=3425949 RepID=UPI003D7FD8CA